MEVDLKKAFVGETPGVTVCGRKGRAGENGSTGWNAVRDSSGNLAAGVRGISDPIEPRGGKHRERTGDSLIRSPPANERLEPG